MRKYTLLTLFLLLLLLTGCRVILEETPAPFFPTETSPPPSTITPQPSATATITATSAPEPEPQVLPSDTPLPRPPFGVLPDAPILTSAFLHTEEGCSWMGVAGQVFGIKGEPLTDIVVVVTGNIGGRPFEGLGYTGSAAGYGPGGYEITISGSVEQGIFWIQIFDAEERPLSEAFSFRMEPDCTKNLALINFRQEDPGYTVNLPLIQH